MATSVQKGMLKSWDLIAQRRPYIPFISLAKIPLRSVLRLWFITIVWSTVTSLAARWMNLTRCARSGSRPWRAVPALKAPTLTMRRNVCLQMTAPATTKARLFSLATPSRRINSCGELFWWCSVPGDIRAHLLQSMNGIIFTVRNNGKFFLDCIFPCRKCSHSKC